MQKIGKLRDIQYTIEMGKYLGGCRGRGGRRIVGLRKGFKCFETFRSACLPYGQTRLVEEIQPLLLTEIN